MYADGADEGDASESYNAHSLLHELAVVFSEMDADRQTRVYKRVMSSGECKIHGCVEFKCV